MNYLFRSIIILFSEVIWIYFLIAIFTEVEWGQIVYINPLWWIVAAIVGYTVNAILGGRVNYIFLLIINSLILGIIIFNNWQIVVLEGSFIFNLIITIAVCFTFIRSASFIYIEPTRAQMLLRFEGNVVIYILFSVFFFVNNLGNDEFHLLFLFAIFMSLIGMLLTLQNNQTETAEQFVDVHSVGKSGWFTGLISFLFLGVTLLCAVFFLPSIRNILYITGINSLEGMQWALRMISTLFAWFFQLFPTSNRSGEMPLLETEGPMILEENEEMVLNIPYHWIIVTVCVIGLIIFIWIISKFLKQWQRPKVTKPKGRVSFSASFFPEIKIKMALFIKKMQKSWMKRFSRFYVEPIYWSYYQLQKWGEKNGFPLLKTETSKEYIKKITTRLKNELTQDESAAIILQLDRLSEDYQRTYYSRKSDNDSDQNYKQLLVQLKTLNRRFK